MNLSLFSFLFNIHNELQDAWSGYIKPLLISGFSRNQKGYFVGSEIREKRVFIFL
jgi:hypothetical protein